MTARQVQLLVLLVMVAAFLGKGHWVGFFDGHEAEEGCSSSASKFCGARAENSISDMEPRPSLRPLAPLIGTLAGLWLGAAAMIAAQLL